jgi:hypothetical protein
LTIIPSLIKEIIVNPLSSDPTKSPRIPASFANATLAFVMIVLLPNCGSSGDSPDKACATLAKAQCDRRQACTNAIQPDGVFILNTYGDMPTCLARQQEACVNNATAPGTGTSPAQLEKCASEYASWSCADLFDGNANPPPDCAPAGKLANGRACAMAGQCASRFCSGTKNASCGLCADEPLDGASCTTSGCAPGQACKTETNDAMVCRDRLLVGDMTCTTDTLCQAFSTCVGASATKTGVCTPTSSVVAAPCGGTNPACESNLGLACLGTAGAKTCQQVAYVRDKAACGTLPDGSRAECINADCFTTRGPAAATDTDATCLAQVADGAACDTQFGPLCLAPARCVTSAGTTGICTVPIATACP